MFQSSPRDFIFAPTSHDRGRPFLISYHFGMHPSPPGISDRTKTRARSECAHTSTMRVRISKVHTHLSIVHLKHTTQQHCSGQKNHSGHTVQHIDVAYLHGNFASARVVGVIRCQIDTGPWCLPGPLSQESPCSLAQISATDLLQIIPRGARFIVGLDCNLDKIRFWCRPLIFGLVPTVIAAVLFVWGIRLSVYRILI